MLLYFFYFIYFFACQFCLLWFMVLLAWVFTEGHECSGIKGTHSSFGTWSYGIWAQWCNSWHSTWYNECNEICGFPAYKYTWVGWFLNCMISVLTVQDSKKKEKDLVSWEADLKRREKVILFVPWLNTSICKCSTWFMLLWNMASYFV